jgi:hypothetical protein
MAQEVGVGVDLDHDHQLEDRENLQEQPLADYLTSSQC